MSNQNSISYIFRSKESGLTLMELLIAVTIFIFVMMSLTSIIIGLSAAQRNGIITQNMQENIRFAMEMISREIKLTQRSNSNNDPSGICVPHGKNFKILGDTELFFINYSGQCVKYSVENDAIWRRTYQTPFNLSNPTQQGKITSPTKVKIHSLKFAKDINGNILGDTLNDNKQPQIVISLKAQAVDKRYSPIYQIQTTISQRELDVE